VWTIPPAAPAAIGPIVWSRHAQRLLVNGGPRGAVRWRSPGVVTVNTPAPGPASCMNDEVALSGCVWSKLWTPFERRVSQKSRNEKCYIVEFVHICVTVSGEVTVNRD
jgi:hypothetical protein